MKSESSERRIAKPNQMGTPPASEPEKLQCPRCDCTNTKFCYYNNYNFAQPRHFCKGCRRYWTHGGALRDIPVGGGSNRKNAKRSRYHAAVSAQEFQLLPPPASAASQLLVPFSGDQVGPMSFKSVGNGYGSFASLMNTYGPGFFGLGGIGSGLEEMGFGLGKAVRPFPGFGIGPVGAATDGREPVVVGNHWPLESSGGNGGGDVFPLSGFLGR